MKAVYLYPQGSFQTPLRSDTLWGMLCWGIRALYGEAELENMLRDAVSGKPEFIISSTMPFYETGGEKHRFYPLPYNLAAQPDAVSTAKSLPERKREYRQRKQIKKIKYLTEKDFKRAIEGKLRKENLLKTDSAKVRPTVASVIVTHNTIDRISLSTLDKEDAAGNLAGQLFHNEEFFVNLKGVKDVQSGLFFLTEGNTEKIEAVLRYYRHRGMGANSSVGKGVFRGYVEDFTEIIAPADGDVLVNLSLYSPHDKERNYFDMQSDKCAYLTEIRGGKIGQYLINRNKSKVPCFREGSVLVPAANAEGRSVYGKILCEEYEGVSHNVYRNYMGLMIKMKSC